MAGTKEGARKAAETLRRRREAEPELAAKLSEAVIASNKRRTGEKHDRTPPSPESEVQRRANVAEANRRRKGEKRNVSPEGQASQRAGVIASNQRRAGEKRALSPAGREVLMQQALRMAAANPPTPQELKVAAALTTLGMSYTLHDTHAGREMDVYVASKKLDIEVDGAFHQLSQRKRRDRERDERLTAQGYKVLRLTHAEIDGGTFVTKLAAALS